MCKNNIIYLLPHIQAKHEADARVAHYASALDVFNHMKEALNAQELLEIMRGAHHDDKK